MAATTAIHHHHQQTLSNFNITTSFTSINMPSSSSSCSSIGGASSLSSSSNHDDRRFVGHHQHNRKQGNNSQASPPPLLARAASAESSILLPLDFKPGPYTVICGRGRKVQESIGNRRLTVLAQLFIPQYAKATRKDEKSTIVSEIVRIVQEASQEPNRAFVRQASDHDRWCQVDNLHAREKVGTVLRDLLSEKYRSSTKSKLVRRKERRQEQETKKSSSPSSSNPTSGIVPILMTPQPLPSMMDISLADDFVHIDSDSVL